MRTPRLAAFGRLVSKSWSSLVGRSLVTVILVALLSNLAGSLTGWLVLRNENAGMRAADLAFKAGLVVDALRRIYTYVTVDAAPDGRVLSLTSAKLVGDADSILTTGMSPEDVVVEISNRFRTEVWFLERTADGGLRTLATSTSRAGASPTFSPGSDLARLAAAPGAPTFADFAGERHFVAVIPLFRSPGQVIGALAVSSGREVDLLAPEQQLALRSILLLLATSVLAILLSLVLFSRLFRPIPALVRATQSIAGDDLDTPMTYQQRRDEIGDLARAIETLRGNMIARRDARRREDAATQAELMRQRAMEESIQAFRVSVADVLRRVEAELESTTGAADRMSSIATSAQTKMEGVSSASRQLSSGSVSIASAVEQLAASVSEISRLSEETLARVQSMSGASSRTEGTISQLSAASERIGTVTDIIRNLADASNLLALNATIEAARAGAAGKGFGVVAAEVKQLANQTAASTVEISACIDEIRALIADSVASIRNVSTLSGSTREATTMIAAAIQEQQAVASDIAHTVAHASTSTSRLEDSIGFVSTSIHSTQEAAGHHRNAAVSLSRDVGLLRQSIDDFLERVVAI